MDGFITGVSNFNMNKCPFTAKIKFMPYLQGLERKLFLTNLRYFNQRKKEIKRTKINLIKRENKGIL